MYHFSSGVIGGLIAVSFLGFLSQDTGATRFAHVSHSPSIGDTVNRSAKGDRLYPSQTMISSEAWKDELNARMKTRPAKTLDETSVPAEMPVGCEPAVSIALDDILAKIPSRCLSSLPRIEAEVG